MKTLGTLLITTLLFAGCSRPAARALPPEQARSLLENRTWLSKMPESRREPFQLFRFMPEMNSSGIYQDRTVFAGAFELFHYESSGDEIRFNMVHTGERKTAHYTIEPLRPGEGPADFDLRLTVERSPRGGVTYYGWSQEGRGKLEDLDRELGKRLPE